MINTRKLSIPLALLLALLLVLPPATASAPPAAGAARQQRALDAYMKMPLYFIANQGQRDESVAYYAQGGGYSLAFTASEVILALGETVLRARFAGAEPTHPAGVGEQAAKVNYFVGSDPARWQTDIPTYGEVVYHDLYPGLDLRYEGRTGALKYTLVVAPGADVAQFRLAYEGADGLRVDETGDLLILTGGEELRDTRPYAYQEIGGRRVEVRVAFALRDAHTIGFTVQDDYDPRYPLVIDPTLDYATYLGGSDKDQGYGIAVDGNGNVYVTGIAGTDFPLRNAYQETYQGNGLSSFGGDVFVAKIDPTRSGDASLIYATYLGGSSSDDGNGIAVDKAGNAYVTGQTYSTDFPTQNAYQPTCPGNLGNAFVTKLNASGNGLVYSTYLGTETVEAAYAIAVDGEGNAYVTGETDDLHFPTQNPYQPSHGGGVYDVFVTKFNAAGSGLVYSTFLGGNGTERGYGIAVDEDGNAYVTGHTSSADFPTSTNAYQTTYGGGWDAFVAKFNAAGSTLLYSTFLGGSSGLDTGHAIAVDEAGNAYVAGETQSNNFPTKNAYQGTYGGGTADAFVARIDTTQSGAASLTYSTYLGGSNIDVGWGIAIDGDSNAHVTGPTTSDDFPSVNAYQPIYGGNRDAFVAKFDVAGSMSYSTYLGGDYRDVSKAIAVDGDGSVYLTGYAESGFPTKNAYQATMRGEEDVFVAVLGSDRIDLSTSRKQVSPATIAPTGTVTHTLSYTITLANTGNLTATAASLTDTLPASLVLTGSPVCSSGVCAYNAGDHTITWTGGLTPTAAAAITYTGQVSVTIGTTETIYFVNTAQVDDGVNAPFALTARSAVNPIYLFLPIVLRSYAP